MAADCAKELKKHNVACISLWPGLTVHTEFVKEYAAKFADTVDPATGLKVEYMKKVTKKTGPHLLGMTSLVHGKYFYTRIEMPWMLNIFFSTKAIPINCYLYNKVTHKKS